MKEEIDAGSFFAADIRVGTITKVEIPEGMRRPAYRLWIDFGEVGELKTSAQITDLYKPDDLIDTQVVAVVNFPDKQIGSFMSQCLVLGAVNDDKEVVLLRPDSKCDNGLHIS